jgi:hypothetical protein
MKIGKYRASFRRPKNPVTDGPSLSESRAVAEQLAREQAEREAAAKARMDALRARGAQR